MFLSDDEIEQQLAALRVGEPMTPYQPQSLNPFETQQQLSALRLGERPEFTREQNASTGQAILQGQAERYRAHQPTIAQAIKNQFDPSAPIKGLLDAGYEAGKAYAQGDVDGWDAVKSVAVPALAAGASVPGSASLPAPGKAPRTLNVNLNQGNGGRKYVGAPRGVNTPQGEAGRRAVYKTRMTEGVGGAPWYEESGGAIKFHTGDRPEMALPLTEGMAATSSSTSVPANTGFGIKGHNQAVMGKPVVTGRFPASMGPIIEQAYSGTGGVTGAKRTPFSDQLAIGGGFYPGGRQGHRAVHDIWDGEAWGYVNADGTPLRRLFQPTEHAWMDRQMDRVISEANRDNLGGRSDWTPGRAQAASWTGAKIRAGDIKPEQAGYSYADDFPRHYAQGSRETVPGSNTGHMRGLLDAPPEVRDEYHQGINRIIYDDKGRDRLSLANKGLTGAKFDGPGIYEGINPGTQTQVAVGSDAVHINPRTGEPVPEGTIVERWKPKQVMGPGRPGPAPATREVDPASRKLMDANEATYGLLTGQKAAAWNKTFDAPTDLRNAVEVPLGRTLTNEQAAVLMKTPGFNPDAMAVVPTPDGVRIANFGMDPAAFDAYVTTARKSLGADRPAGVRMDGNLMQNDWDQPQGRVGQQYRDVLADPEYPVLRENFDRAAPQIAAQIRDYDAAFSKKYGFEVSPILQDLRSAIAAEGLNGVASLAKRLGLGMAMVAPLLSVARDFGMLPQEEQNAPPGLL